MEKIIAGLVQMDSGPDMNENKDIDVAALSVTSDTKKVKDLHDRPLLLFTHPWSVQTALDRNEGLQLSEPAFFLYTMYLQSRKYLGQKRR